MRHARRGTNSPSDSQSSLPGLCSRSWRNLITPPPGHTVIRAPAHPLMPGLQLTSARAPVATSNTKPRTFPVCGTNGEALMRCPSRSRRQRQSPRRVDPQLAGGSRAEWPVLPTRNQSGPSPCTQASHPLAATSAHRRQIRSSPASRTMTGRPRRVGGEGSRRPAEASDSGQQLRKRDRLPVHPVPPAQEWPRSWSVLWAGLPR